MLMILYDTHCKTFRSETTDITLIIRGVNLQSFTAITCQAN